MDEQVQKLMEKADHALEIAERTYKHGFARDAVPDLYSAMTKAVQALLKSEGIDIVGSSFESAFDEHFIKTQRVDTRYYRLLCIARLVFELNNDATQEEIRHLTNQIGLEDGKEFVQVIKATIKRA